MPSIKIKSDFNFPLSLLFDWHTNDGAFERLNPPWCPFYIISKKGNVENEGTVKIKLPIIRNIGIKWFVKHSNYIKNKTFSDVQTKGLFSYWEHQHNFYNINNISMLEDIVKYELPFGNLGNIFSKSLQNKLYAIFRYRHRITKMDLDAHQNFKNQLIKNVIISGSHGYIGNSLIPFLTTGGYNVTRVIRNNNLEKDYKYDIAKSIFLNSLTTPSNLESSSQSTESDRKFDAAINLNGENIFGIWTKNKKNKIFESRVKHTRIFCKYLVELDVPPRVLISASAIGIYGNDSEKTFSDTDNIIINKNDFFSKLCSEWEQATDIAKSAGIRVVNLRTGIVLGSSGGILKKLTNINKIKINLKLNNNNWLSWIALDDLLRIILFCMTNDSVEGPVNSVTTSLIKYQDFLKVLEKVWNTKLNINLNSSLLEIILGEMSKYTILSDIKASPKKLLLNGFSFNFVDLESAIRHTLGK
ncbi:MAG TPA: TIGR01777 family oxidoreductase [Candidatus Nitrosocosmicus sp.]